MIERHLVPGQSKPFSHYCHVVRADRHVWVSGAVGSKQDGTIPESTVEQFRVALDSVDACLRKPGPKTGSSENRKTGSGLHNCIRRASDWFATSS
jgi:enamine deaminase RidA (YjgF/YER057c/UK114 family)